MIEFFCARQVAETDMKFTQSNIGKDSWIQSSRDYSSNLCNDTNDIVSGDGASGRWRRTRIGSEGREGASGGRT